MTTASIVSPNPMPSDIDWARVESVLGVRIVQGAPWLGRDDSPSASLPIGAVADDDGNAGRDEQPVHDIRVVGDLLPGIHALGNAYAQGRDVLVVTEPDLVAAVYELLGHKGLRSSVAPTTRCASAASPSVGAGGAPEGSDAAGSMSPDSAASFSRHSGFVDCACGRYLVADSPDLEWVRINDVRHGRSNCRPSGDAP